MSFHDVQFPPQISYGATGGPSFLTVIATATRSKREWRDIILEEGEVIWNVATGIQTDAELSQTIAFIRVRRGRAYSFRFKDWTDYVMDRQVIGTGDAVEVDFQLFKTYDDGYLQVDRTLSKPVDGTLQVWVNNALQTEGVDYTVDYLAGIITFATAPADTLSIEAACEFDVPVRFEKDALKINMRDFDSNRSTITVREVYGE